MHGKDEMNKIKLASVIVLFLFTLRAHADDFKVLDLEYTMPIDVPWIRIITNHVDWLSFYYELLSAQGIVPDESCGPGVDVLVPPAPDCSPPAPIVDFDDYQIIVGGLGIRYNGSAKIVVSDVDATSSSALMINVIDLNPSDECVVSTVINHPMAAVAVPRSDKPVNVSVEEATLRCH